MKEEIFSYHHPVITSARFRLLISCKSFGICSTIKSPWFSNYMYEIELEMKTNVRWSCIAGLSVYTEKLSAVLLACVLSCPAADVI